VSGLWMAASPIDEVRGAALRAETPVLNVEKPLIFPLIFGKFAPIDSIRLVQQARGPVWIISLHDNRVFRASADEGRWLAPVDETEARTIAAKAFRGRSALVGMKRFTAAQAPLDLRKNRPSWQARFSDGTHLYVDAQTGEILALRTRQWRLYDWMWGLHIMDLQGREATSHLVLILFAGVAAFGSLWALVLLPMASWRKRHHDL
jgi:Peptidase propeptide and YPEB domain